MARVTVEDCVDKVPNRFELVMLAATLWPLVGLMLGVAVIVLLVSRELMRSARRLEGALERAKAADRIKTEFLSNVSHELELAARGREQPAPARRWPARHYPD